jgi:hypothetical protein
VVLVLVLMKDEAWMIGKLQLQSTTSIVLDCQYRRRTVNQQLENERER